MISPIISWRTLNNSLNLLNLYIRHDLLRHFDLRYIDLLYQLTRHDIGNLHSRLLHGRPWPPCHSLQLWLSGQKRPQCMQPTSLAALFWFTMDPCAWASAFAQRFKMLAVRAIPKVSKHCNRDLLCSPANLSGRQTQSLCKLVHQPHCNLLFATVACLLVWCSLHYVSLVVCPYLSTMVAKGTISTTNLTYSTNSMSVTCVCTKTSFILITFSRWHSRQYHRQNK